MKKRAYEVSGKAASVRQVEDFGTYNILIGEPKRNDADRQYHAAKRILLDAPVKVRIIDENETEAFASELEHSMVSHGILSSELVP